MPDSEITEAFAAKVDAFAASLEPEEQALLIELLTTGDDVAGFGAGAAWPGLFTLGSRHRPGGKLSEARIPMG